MSRLDEIAAQVDSLKFNVDMLVRRLDGVRNSKKWNKYHRTLKQNRVGGEYTNLLKEGELAFKRGQPESSNPYSGEDAEIWKEGWNDMRDNS